MNRYLAVNVNNLDDLRTRLGNFLEKQGRDDDEVDTLLGIPVLFDTPTLGRAAVFCHEVPDRLATRIRARIASYPLAARQKVGLLDAIPATWVRVSEV
jgi:hypothetical protein